jgi:putative component of toxin-antitoxin plasmid stabilization module
MNTIYTTDVFDAWLESLVGGDKSSQSTDIATAQALALKLKE